MNILLQSIIAYKDLLRAILRQMLETFLKPNALWGNVYTVEKTWTPWSKSKICLFSKRKKDSLMSPSFEVSE